MDFANRGGQKPQAQQVAPQKDGGSMGGMNDFTPPSTNKSSGSKGFDIGKLGQMLLLVGITLIVVLLIIMLMTGKSSEDPDSPTVSAAYESSQIETDKYQALFLDSQDGQVYFGKLEVISQDLYKLTDIFYVRVNNPIQPEGEGQQQQRANISLAKLGNELHGPEDVMFVRRDKVLYWENLKNVKCSDDAENCSQVYSAIQAYIDNGRQTTQPTTQQQSTEEQQPAEQENQTP